MMLPEEQIAALMTDADDPATGGVAIDVGTTRLKSTSVDAAFTLSVRHRRMFLEELDVIGLSRSLQHRGEPARHAR